MNKRVTTLSLGVLLLCLGACSSKQAENSSPAHASPQPETSEPVFTLRAYGGDLETQLGLTLLVYEDHPGYQIHLLMENEEYTSYAEILWTGDLSLETINEVQIFDVPWVESHGENTKSTMTLVNSEQGLVLQNYGNAMNYFQVLPLDQKYIYFLPDDAE